MGFSSLPKCVCPPQICWKKFCTFNQGRHYVAWTPAGTKVFLVERDDSYIELLLSYLYKLIHFVHVCVAFWHLIVVIILLCHYLVLIYVHFHISHVISWSSHGDGHCRLLAGVTFLNQEFFRIHFTRPRNIAKSLKYCCLICLMSSGGTLELYFSTSLTLVCWWTGANLRGHWVPPFLVGMGPPLPKCPASQ